MSIAIRPAQEEDVPHITQLVNGYAARNIMLPRTEENVRRTVADWLVAIDNDDETNAIAGCGALVALSEELVEIRSLAIHESQQGKGIGGQIVDQLVVSAREREFKQVCALTLSEGFFINLGFELVDRWSISPKVWQECIYCPKFHRCDEVAVLMNLAHELSAGQARSQPAAWSPLLKWEVWQPLRLAYSHKADAQTSATAKSRTGANR